MTVAVVLLTYNRLEYATRTLESAAKNLESNRHDFRWHIASDGDPNEYIASLHDVLCMRVGHSNITKSNSERGGYGRNYNLAMQTAHQLAEWILPLEDDWELTRPLNIDGVIHDMEELNIGCARLGYVGYTQELRGTLLSGRHCGHWLMFDPKSHEPHVFAGHPRIEYVKWSREVGPWREGINPGDTEFEVTHRPAARRRVAWPLDVVRPSGGMFVHIGTKRSY